MEKYFRKYYHALCLFAKGMIGDGDVSEDIVQDVFVKIISSGIKFESELHFRQYVYVAVKNTCYKFLVKSEKMVIAGNEDDIDITDESDSRSDIAIIRGETLRMIKESINSLSPRYREVFVMAYIKKMKNEEIAEALGISVNTVKVMRQRAKAKLRETLKDLFPLLFIYLNYLE